jgi:hypothetical protein
MMPFIPVTLTAMLMVVVLDGIINRADNQRRDTHQPRTPHSHSILSAPFWGMVIGAAFGLMLDSAYLLFARSSHVPGPTGVALVALTGVNAYAIFFAGYGVFAALVHLALDAGTDVGVHIYGRLWVGYAKYPSESSAYNWSIIGLSLLILWELIPALAINLLPGGSPEVGVAVGRLIASPAGAAMAIVFLIVYATSIYQLERVKRRETPKAPSQPAPAQSPTPEQILVEEVKGKVWELYLTSAIMRQIQDDPKWEDIGYFEAYLNRNYPGVIVPRGTAAGEDGSGVRFLAGDVSIVAKRVKDSQSGRVFFEAASVRREPPSVREEENPFRLLTVGESLIVDVSNVVRRCGKHGASMPCPRRGPVWVVVQLADQKDEWKKSAVHGEECVMVADANLRYHVDDEARFDELIRTGDIVQTPARQQADATILRLADKKAGVVLTNDAVMRRDYGSQYPWVKDPGRFINYTPISDEKKEVYYSRLRQPESLPRGAIIRIFPPRPTGQRPSSNQS